MWIKRRRDFSRVLSLAAGPASVGPHSRTLHGEEKCRDTPRNGAVVSFPPPALNVGWAAEFMRLLLPGLFLGREVLE